MDYQLTYTGGNASRPFRPAAEAPEVSTRAPGSTVTHFNFQHAVFKTPGARFLLSGEHRRPIFRVEMGELRGLVDISLLKREFNIALDSHDGRLIDLAVAGLRYVLDIKPGDSIPSEILTGKASWSVSSKHRSRAEQRLQVQLVSWVSGKEMLLTDPNEIGMFLEQIENRERLRQAFRNAAKALGYEPENTEPVVMQLELLARELCYIEALRDRYTVVPKLGERMADLAKSFGSDRNAKFELVRIQNLFQMGVQEYSGIFAEADAQTGEIIAALKSIERQVRYIRKIRDDLHFLLMLWEPHIADLPKWRPRRTLETDKVLSNLYRFLAPRFSSGRSIMKRPEDTKARDNGKINDREVPTKIPTGDKPREKLKEP